MRTAMVISPHADDATLFCGATLAKLADQGWRVVLVRVTNDSKDSVGLTKEETIRRNTAGLHEAAATLGVAEIVELGYENDTMGDVSEVALRERIVYQFRKYRPYVVFTFDPFGLYETNMDHIRTAQAVEEAFWVGRFDQNHPEHFDEGLAPVAICEQWYFARRLPEQNHAEDVTGYLEKKIDAACAHEPMINHIRNQCRMLLEAWGGPVPDAVSVLDGDSRPLLAGFLHQQAAAVAEAAGLGEGQFAEAFRRVRFGDLAGVLEGLGIPPPAPGEGLG